MEVPGSGNGAERVREPFKLTVALSETLVISTEQLLQKLRDEYPELGTVLAKDVVSTPGPVQEVLGSMEDHVLVCEGLELKVRVMPLFFPFMLDHYESAFRRALRWPDAKQALWDNKAHVSIEINSTGTGLEERLDAACFATCVGGVFASLPTALGVFWAAGDVIAKPEHWVAAARQVAEGQIPYFDWISFELKRTADGCVGVDGVGMAAFNGYEISFGATRLPADVVLRYFQGATALLIEAGHDYGDRDTLALEEAHDAVLTIRLVPEGYWGNNHPQTPLIAVIHPDSIINPETLETRDQPSEPSPENALSGAARLRGMLRRVR